jgi:hypothetical protein
MGEDGDATAVDFLREKAPGNGDFGRLEPRSLAKEVRSLGGGGSELYGAEEIPPLAGRKASPAGGLRPAWTPGGAAPRGGRHVQLQDASPLLPTPVLPGSPLYLPRSL